MIYSVSFPQKDVLQHELQLDGSKSISNRLLILRALGESPFDIDNISNSDDSNLMQAFFDGFPDEETFNVQNAGTVARFLTAFLAAQPGEWTLNCAPPMLKRPIKLLVDALIDLGAEIDYLDRDGYFPIKIQGKLLVGNYVSIPADVSSQYISALMMIAPSMPNGLTIHLEGEIASLPYLEITAGLMRTCGLDVSFEGQEITVRSGTPTDKTVFCESDWSAAAFYYTMIALQPNSSLTLTKLLSPQASDQGDAAVAKVFEQLGVSTRFHDKSVVLSQTASPNPRFEEDFLDKPDMVPAVAVTCAALGVPATFTGVRNLVIKESNRLEALKTELAKVGVEFNEVTKDKWVLEGKIDSTLIQEVVFDTYEDHRIAMCFGSLAAYYPSVKVNEPHVVSKSYPAFWDDLKSLGFHIEEV